MQTRVDHSEVEAAVPFKHVELEVHLPSAAMHLHLALACTTGRRYIFRLPSHPNLELACDICKSSVFLLA